MRQTTIIAALVAIAATLAIWGATAIVANPQKPSTHTFGASSIDVMQMMRNAKDLPEQHYDAH
jgi:hypothetical protein